MNTSPRLDGSSGLYREGAIRHDRQQPQRYIVGDSADISDGGAACCRGRRDLGGYFRVEGRLYAYLNVCAHMGGPACQGKLLPRVLDVIDEDRTMHQRHERQ